MTAEQQARDMIERITGMEEAQQLSAGDVVELANLIAKHDPLKTLAELGSRLHGADLSFRRHGTDWPMPWKARLHATKNERAEYRMEEFGQTADEAVAALAQRVKSMDAEQFILVDMLARNADPKA